MSTAFAEIRAQEIEDWNRNADFYEQEGQAPLARLLREKRCRFYGLGTMTGKRVLDLGCGTGWLTQNLPPGNWVAATDFSERMLTFHRQKHSGTMECPVLADARDLPFADHTFDMIVMDGLLHHLKIQGILPESLAEARRVLKDSGQIFVFDRNGSLPASILLHAIMFLRKWTVLLKENLATSSARHEPAFGGKTDLRQIENAGFRIARKQPLATLPFFMSVVLTNAIGYFFSRPLANRIQKMISPLAGWCETHLAFRILCVEQCLEIVKGDTP